MYSLFKNKKINHEKLISFGFNKLDDIYKYSVGLLDGTFELDIEIKEPNIIKTKLIENETQEEYTLHNTNVEGKFVGKVREEYRKTLNDIAENCFDMSVFKADYAIRILEYVKAKYGDEEEYLWEKFPDNAIVRRKDNRKWYVAILTVKKNRLGFDDSDDYIEVVDLRVEKDDLPQLLKQKHIYPGYHMNKKSWITIILNGSLKFDYICKKIDKSYELAGSKNRRKNGGKYSNKK